MITWWWQWKKRALNAEEDLKVSRCNATLTCLAFNDLKAENARAVAFVQEAGEQVKELQAGVISATATINEQQDTIRALRLQVQKMSER